MNEIELSAFDFETERRRLRTLETGDETLLHDFYTDPETMRFVAPPLSAEQAAGRFRNILTGMHEQPIKWLSLAMLEKWSGAFGYLWYATIRCGHPHARSWHGMGS